MSDKTEPLADESGDDVDKLVAACSRLLPLPEKWAGVAGYPEGIALAVIDAIWSIGTRYPITRGVIGRYRGFRRRGQADASNDSLTDLLDLYERLGGIDAFIDTIGTRNRVSTQPGATRKAEAVHTAASLLKGLGLDTAEQFRAADGTELGRSAQEAWRTVPGQGSGISWRYLRMLLGLPDVKPDRMVRRFTAAALGVEQDTLAPDDVATLVQAAATRMNVDPRALDHEIWEYQSGRAATHDPQSTREHLKTAARAFIGAAMPAFAEYNLIPTSFYRPYLRAGHDYEGAIVLGLPEFKELESALARAYPHRFPDTPPADIDREFPITYILRLLEASVARCAANAEEYEADSDSTAQSLDELITLLDSGVEQLRCCRAVSHVTTSSGQPVEVAGVTIYPETEPGSLQDQARTLIPRALDEEVPHAFGPPQSLLVTAADVAAGEVHRTWESHTARIDRFMLLSRLLFAGTHQSCWQIDGPATAISRVSPRHRAFGEPFTFALVERIVRLSSEHDSAFTALGDYLDAADVNRVKMLITTFDIAVYRFTKAYEAHDPYESIVDLATALEATLISDDQNTEAVTARLRLRAATLLATATDMGATISTDINVLYSLRSTLVHGGSLKEAELVKKLAKISTVPEKTPTGIALALAVDRLRDLVRRAFLARLCLASGPDALWPYGKESPVDVAMVDDRQRAQWRAHWQNTLAELGVPEAAQSAPPAADFLTGPRPGNSEA